MSDDDSKIDDAERRLFRTAIGNVTPLGEEDRVPTPRPTPSASRPAGEQPLSPDRYSDIDEEPLAGGDVLVYARPGLQYTVLRRLRGGRLPVEGELDLHGSTADQARRDLYAFLRQCQARGLRSVRIVHGKGYGSQNEQPVIKTRLGGWLRQDEAVLAYCSARPADGGTGAVYVLLRVLPREAER